MSDSINIKIFIMKEVLQV